MSDNKEMQMEKEPKASSIQKRRSFLKKAAVGASIAAIPSHSVWAGRLISGNMSGNVSGWANECDLSILSHGGYKNHYKDLVPNKTFRNIFGGDPILGASTTSKLFKNGIEKKLKLAQILNAESGWIKEVKVKTGETGDVYTALPASALTVTEKDWKRRGTKIGTKYTYKYEVAGPSNVNIQLIAMYLNAKLSGTNGVYYPVVGVGKPFSTLTEYVDYIYAAALSNPSSVGSELAAIIDAHHMGTGC